LASRTLFPPEFDKTAKNPKFPFFVNPAKPGSGPGQALDSGLHWSDDSLRDHPICSSSAFFNKLNTRDVPKKEQPLRMTLSGCFYFLFIVQIYMRMGSTEDFFP
jgi:hypothetical protein